MKNIETTKQKLPTIDFSTFALQGQHYLSVKEAAQLMGISPRSVYGYIEAGKLPAFRVGNMLIIEAERVQGYQRQAVGRRRTRVPVWHIPPLMNAQYLTSITVRMRQGQDELFEQKIIEIRTRGKHHLPGTAARYIVRSQVNPEDVQIIFVWRQTCMPSHEERTASLAALSADLSDILDWETARFQEGQVVLTA